MRRPEQPPGYTSKIAGKVIRPREVPRSRARQKLQHLFRFRIILHAVH